MSPPTKNDHVYAEIEYHCFCYNRIMSEEIIESQKDESVLLSQENPRQLEPNSPAPESLGQKERLSIESIQTLLKQERFDTLQNYDSLCSYTKSRAGFLHVKKPVNLFLRSEYMGKTQYGSALNKLRYNPISQEPYTGDWQWTTRAFHSAEGTFLDFPAHPRGKPQINVLEGYEATDSLIDFAYTCEHELQHDIQTERIKGK